MQFLLLMCSIRQYKYKRYNEIFIYLHNCFLLQEQMVLRHHNEAESLNAVQKLDWEWKMNEISTGSRDQSGTSSSFASIDDLYVPTVRVSDDFALSTS